MTANVLDVSVFEQLRKLHVRDQLVMMLLVDSSMAGKMQIPMNDLHRIAGWFDIPVRLHMNILGLPPKLDELSSIYLENQSPNEPLVFTVVVNGHIVITNQTIMPGCRLVFDLLWDAMPLFALQVTEPYLLFSHTNVRMKMRFQLLQYHDLRAFRERPMFLVVPNTSPRIYYISEDSFLSPFFWKDAPANAPGFIAQLRGVYLPYLRKFEWVAVPEISPGIYQLPTQEFLTSIFVRNPETHPITLLLRPIFRHSYFLQPGHNCVELFFEEFSPPTGFSFFFHGPPNLHILVRAGQSCVPTNQEGDTYPLKASPMLVTSSGFIYRRLPNSVQFIDAVNERSVAQHACLLALHRRIGRDSKLQVYFQHTPLHETMLFREIWDFLDDGR